MNEKINNLHKEINVLKKQLENKEKELLYSGQKIHDLNNQLFKKNIIINNNINIKKQLEIRLSKICNTLRNSTISLDDNIKK